MRYSRILDGQILSHQPSFFHTIFHHQPPSSFTMMATNTMFRRIGLVSSLLLVLALSSDAFVTSKGGVTTLKLQQRRIHHHHHHEEVHNDNNDDSNDDSCNFKNEPAICSRRDILAAGIALGVATQTLTLTAQPVNAAETEGVYKPAKRPTAYRVDSTMPPTLLPLDASKERTILTDLGRGSGTDKAKIVVDTVNLNNILNKAVFGTIETVKTLANPKDESKSGPGYATFVCLGLPRDTTTATDIDLAQGLLQAILKPRMSNKKAATALGFAALPVSTQAALDAYSNASASSSASEDLVQAIMAADVSEATVQLLLPLLQYAKSQSLDLLAMAPETQDVKAVRAQGLQASDPVRRAQYVVDTPGFIALPQDPGFKLYTDRSLLKDYDDIDGKGDGRGNFFAERILVHETAATVAAQYAVRRPESLVAIVAATPDLRFLRGINGRIARVCQYLNPNDNKVTNDCVTTILLNPTAKETLSKTRFLRLEVGTGPKTLAYQTKVADYLWFSSMPKVNLITRLMDGQ
jgi:hypothetical protein